MQGCDTESRAENADSDWEESGFPERDIARGRRGNHSAGLSAEEIVRDECVLIENCEDQVAKAAKMGAAR